MFVSQIPLLEIVARVAIVYFALAVFLRLGGKKELGQLTPMNLLSMLLISETVSPALTRQDPSLSAGLVAAATLLAATILLDRLTFRYRSVERLLEGMPVLLVKNGRILEAARRREHITRGEIRAALREQGVENLGRVRRAYVETTGEISVVPRSGRP